MQLYLIVLLLAINGATLCSGTYYCSNPGAPANGHRAGNDFSIGSSVHFTCSEGYELIGASTITCYAYKYELYWSDDTPICIEEYETTKTKPKCGKEPKSGRHAAVKYSTKTVLVFECESDKYVVESGDEVVRCLDRKWIGEPLKCKHKAKCPVYKLSPNTHKVMTGSLEGDTVSFSCSSGYALSSSNHNITCTSSGKWSAHWPSCQALNCGNPPSLDNGVASYHYTTYRSLAYYLCKTGYKRIGANTIHCMSSGEWSNLAVRCEIIQCPIPVTPINGNVHYRKTSYNSTADYVCNSGYIINGTNRRTCRHDGSWYPSPPHCEPIHCNQLSNPLNGRVTFVTTTYKSVATYDCNQGYNLVGDNRRRCLSDGKWSSSIPSCSPVICDSNLPNPSNGVVSITETTFGSSVTYKCNDGYILIGNDTRYCQSDSCWSGQIPSCVTRYDIDCGSLSNPIDGLVQFNNTHYQSVAVYKCKTGFHLVGTNYRSCQKNSQWSSKSPTCRAVSCNNLTNPDNGLVNISGMAFGSNAVYSCTTGYILEGTEERTCTANGTWSGVEPTCKIVDCLSLPKLINGVISYTTTTFNSTATYECNEGLILIGPSHRICQENTQWSGDQSLCVLDCGLLQADSITQIHYITSNVQRGLIAEYSCIPGYGIAGSNIRECLEDGLWATNQPQCQAIDCGPLEPPLNGEVLVFNTTLANPARYSCRLGFELIGNEFRVCTINGLWSGISPTCRIIDCGDLPHPENGNVSLTGTIFTSQANYTCFPGYNVSTTQPVRVCTITGDWSGAEPSCTPVDCGPLEPPLNGDVFVFNTTLASPARYSCGLGFKLNGDEFRVCTINGTWSGPEPTCDVIDCGAPPTIPNGHVDFQTTTFASRANYTCNEGYTISGSSLGRFCTDEEKWSGTLPICTEILECPDPGIPVNGRRINDAFTIGSLVYYVCNDGYDIIGSNGRRCQVNGHWTGTPASCVQRNLSCTDNGPVFDSVGRQCTCVDGWMVNCCRYRQDWSNLSDEQRTRYVQAVLNVSSDPIYQPLYQTLMQTYYDSFQTLAQSLDFSSTHFLPWHRFFMQQYEDLLRMIDPSVYIPYWDWTLLPDTPYQHLVFSPNNGFGNESDPNTDCITGGPFRQDQFSLSLKEGCLKRQYNTESLTLLTRSQLEDVLLVQPAFSQFFRLLTVPYLTVRCTVGGTMCNSKESPPVEDPLHLLILSFIDNIWNRWQSMNQQDKLHPHGDDILALANGFKVKDYNNVKNLPYNVSVCYGASADVSSSRQTRSINNYYSCNTQEWMEKLSLDENQRSVLRAVCRFFYTNIIRQ